MENNEEVLMESQETSEEKKTDGPKKGQSKKTKKVEMVKIRLPKLRDQKANQDVFVSVNFKNYIIKRGVEVEVPKEVYEVLMNAEKAEEEAFEFAEENAVREPQ